MSPSQHHRKKHRGKAPLRPIRKANSYLPEELWIHILSLLSVKNLLVVRSVSKLFLSVTDNSDFITLHLSRFPGNLRDKTELSVSLRHSKCDPKNCNRPIYCELRQNGYSNLDSPLTTNFVAGFHLLTNAKILPSTPLDGFIVLMARDDRLGFDVAMLWNPSIRKTRTLPPISPSFYLTSSTALYFGIGYDPSSKDYKVLAVVKELKTDDHRVWVYSLRNHDWTPIQNSTYSALVCPGPGPFTRDTDCCDSVSYQGRLFWTEKWRSEHDFRPTKFWLRLVCFDFVTENFCYCNLPTSWGSLNLLKASCGCGESFIGWQSCDGDAYYGSIWSLEIETMSWTKRYRCDEAYLQVKCVTKNPAVRGYPALTNEGFRMDISYNVESLVLLI